MNNEYIDPAEVRLIKEKYSEELKHRSIAKIFTFLDNAKKRKFNASPDIKSALRKHQ